MNNYIGNDELNSALLEEIFDICIEYPEKINFILKCITCCSCNINEFYEILNILSFIVLFDKFLKFIDIGIIQDFFDVLIEIENENTINANNFIIDKLA